MPPRSVTLAIVAFWLGVTGLFFAQDVWPRLSPDEPLMFPVNIVDEAGPQKEATSWDVAKNGSATYRADVAWNYHAEDDSFESQCSLEWRLFEGEKPEAPRQQGPVWLPQVHWLKMDSTYRLGRNGEMRSVDVWTSYFLVAGQDEMRGIEVTAELNGEPRSRRFAPHLELSFPALKEGERWRATVIDPLGLLGLVAPLDAAQGGALREAGVAADAGADHLDAQVQPGLVRIIWENREVPCHIVRCTGTGAVASLSLWVCENDIDARKLKRGDVMRQEVSLWGDSWTFQRLPMGYKMRSPPDHDKMGPPRLVPLRKRP
jgi:hypothetical protein